MKKILTVICTILLSINPTVAQVNEFITTFSATKYKVNGEWSEWQNKQDIIIPIMFIERAIQIQYSDTTLIFNIETNAGQTFNSDGDETTTFFCTDRNKEMVIIHYTELFSPIGNGELQLDFVYPEEATVYKINHIRSYVPGIDP